MKNKAETTSTSPANTSPESTSSEGNRLMQLQVLLPSKVFAFFELVENIVVETAEGAFGLLPQRQDCVTALEPGILTYTTQGNSPQYLAVDEGVMVKKGQFVSVSVRNAHMGENLTELKLSVQTEFMSLDEEELELRAVLARLESGFMRGFKSLHP